MQPHRFKPESPFHRVAATLMSVPRAWAPHLSRNFFAIFSPRGLVWLVLFIGGVKLLLAWHSEIIGEAYTPGKMPELVRRIDKPQDFQNLMAAKWWEGAFWIAGGMIIRGFIRRQEELDPMSPDFQGQEALDELGESLDREAKHRHEPLR